MLEEGDPTLATCTIRDHALSLRFKDGTGCGVLVQPSAEGRATIGADCVFARNAGGDVMREEA